MDKQEIKRAYKQGNRPMGVYRIRTPKKDRVFIGFSTDLNAIFNRHKTELKFKTHRNKELQEMWNRSGEEGFLFEVLDELDSDNKTPAETNEELRTLMEMWTHKLETAGTTVVPV